MNKLMIDTHTHLNFEAFEENWREVVTEAVSQGVEKMIVVGTDVDSSKKAVEMAEAHEALFAAVGVHPHHSRKYLNSASLDFSQPMTDQNDKMSEILNPSNNQNLGRAQQVQNDINEIEKLVKHPRVVAIGEVGIDYHKYEKSKYDESLLKITDDAKKVQKKILKAQVKLAIPHNKPLILHSREAKSEVLELLADSGGDQKLTPTDSPLSGGRIRGVFHCYEGSKKYLRRILDAGFYVSFCGNITYVPDRADVSREVPLNRLLLETDSPLITPEPHRGLVNTPANVKILAQKQAELRGIQLNKLIEATTSNAYDLFGFS